MLEEVKNILKYRHGDKSLKGLLIIYAGLECMRIKKQPRQNNTKNSYTERKAWHKPSAYSLSLICSFDETKNRRKLYGRKDCIKKFGNDLKELVTEKINHEEKKMAPLKDKEITLYESQKVCHICKGGFCYDKNKESEFKRYHKVRDHRYYTGKFRGAAHSNCNLQYKVAKNIRIVFHNGSTYDYHFITKQLAEDYKGKYRKIYYFFSTN